MASILIVDDDETTAHTFAALLRQEGYTALTAATGTSALRVVAERILEMLLLDVKLPDMSGTEVVHGLKLQGYQGRIVMYTMFPDLDSAFDAGRVGADRYVEGPLNSAELLALVKRALTNDVPTILPQRLPGGAGGKTFESVSAIAVDGRVRRVIELIDAEPGSKLSAHELAARVGLSESRLHHLFKDEMGLSLHEYVVNVRLGHAAHRLRSSVDHVRQIVYSLGLSDLRGFRAAFWRRFRMTPTQNRARYSRIRQ
jgi:YesN/AraC family two-component response regulator